MTKRIVLKTDRHFFFNKDLYPGEMDVLFRPVIFKKCTMQWTVLSGCVAHRVAAVELIDFLGGVIVVTW